MRWVNNNLKIARTINQTLFEQAMKNCMLEMVFNNNENAFVEYQSLSISLQDNYWLNNTKQTKMSTFLDNVFKLYSRLSGLPTPLNKGHFYELIPYLPINEVDNEIAIALSFLIEYLQPI